MQQVPLELFVFLGTFIEEVLSPIPSFIVLVPAGAAAQIQGLTWWNIVGLAVISAFGRIIGGILLYWLADKLEDAVFSKGRKLFGASHKSIEQFGQRLSRKRSVRNWVFLFLLNALPFLPTSLLSLTCGFIKVRFSMFITTSFLGSIINAMFFLSLGYMGLQTAIVISKLESATQIAFILFAFCLLIAWLVYRQTRQKRKHK